MKSKTRTLMLTALLGFAAYFTEPSAPASIRAIAPTEQSITQEMKNERLEKQYRQAAVAAGRVYRNSGCSQAFAYETGRAAVNHKVSPRILAAIVFVESSCNPNAVSTHGDIGLTQIHYRVWKQHTRTEYFNPRINLETGAEILSTYVRAYGLKEGLHAYNSLNCPTDEYSKKVLTAAGLHV